MTIAILLFRTDDFDGALATLIANGFREDAAEDEPMRIMVRRNGLAGFRHLFLRALSYSCAKVLGPWGD
jgi:hypothetical protein